MSQIIAITLLLPGSGFAGDEVDYSAPYITVENGELVTRYPVREHAGADVVTPANSPGEPVDERKSRMPWIAAALIPLLLVIILLIRRRSRV